MAYLYIFGCIYSSNLPGGGVKFSGNQNQSILTDSYPGPLVQFQPKKAKVEQMATSNPNMNQITPSENEWLESENP